MKYINHVLSTVKKDSPILFWIVVVNFIMSLGCILGLVVDDRILVGVNVWIKPLKFTISGGIYTLTVGYLTSIYPYSKLKKAIIDNVVAITMLIEIGIITAQAGRGVQSHYNMSNAVDSILFAAMGIFVAINVLIMAMFIVDTIRLKLKISKSLQWAILIGWVVVFLGSWIGGQMIAQMSHNVGVADGGAGLPLVNWSTIGGDLRVAHFFGLHGIQVIPLFGFWASTKWHHSMKNQIIAVSIFGLLYAGWIAFTFHQAKQGMPLINL